MSYRDQMRGDNIHNMMTDPSIANARIYVGNIPTNDMTKRDLEDRFEKHGPILGVSLNRGFGFVQYEQESSALEAIKLENGAMFRGSQMEVNAARVCGNRGRSDGAISRRGDPENRDSSFRDRSPIDDRVRDRDWRDRDRYDSFSSSKAGLDRGGYYRDSEFSKDSLPFSGQEKFRSSVSDDRASFRPGLSDTRGSLPRDYATPSSIPPVEKPNDCEIIVFNKNQRDYAEYIEHRLKQLGLTVDILFPNEEVPISRVLANISIRGSLYAIVVMPQNEEHHSLTLNILHGLPQEHRNMPLEDAVPLIKRNFDAYIHREKSGNLSGPVPVVPSTHPITERHPDAMQVLLNLLSDNRPLTVLQYDRIIQYLQDKRELQLKLELGDAKDLCPVKEVTNKQQADLQHRILNILNSQTSGAGIGATPTPVAPPAGNWSQNQTAPTPLLNDPNVQKALDSLMQGNVLHKINPSSNVGGSASTLGTPPTQPLFGVWAHQK